MKSTLKIIALLLALVMLFASCDIGGGQIIETDTGAVTETSSDTGSQTEGESDSEAGTSGSDDVVEVETDAPLSPYRASISLTREELEDMITLQDSDFDDVQAKLDAFEEIAVVSSDYEAVDAVYMEFEDAFYHLDTQISLANIVYDLNRDNETAASRYLDGYERYGDIYNEYMAVCKRIYDESPIRDQIFADWTEAEIKMLLSYDSKTQELRQENESLLVEYNELEGKDLTTKGGEIYAQIVTNNNEIAELAGFENYYVYATTEVYGRDYSLDDIAAFKSYIVEYFIPNLDAVNESWSTKYQNLSPQDNSTMVGFITRPFDKLGINYVKGYVNSFENSTGDGFKHLFENKNMVFASASNSHYSAYQTYLEELKTPFCLFGSEGQYSQGIIHEMGHYYAALYNPHMQSYDLAETQSQGNEFLFLQYVSSRLSEGSYDAIREYNIYNVLATSIISSIIDDFEQKVYSLESVEGYSMSDFDAIMTEVCNTYGGSDYIGDAITDMYDYWHMVCPNSPVYYISYATSSIAALSLFEQAERDEAGAREIYRKLIEEVEEDAGFKDSLEQVGLADPFDETTYIAIVKMFE